MDAPPIASLPEASTWLDAAAPDAAPASTLGGEGFAERLLAEAPAGPGEPAAAPGTHTDIGSKTGIAQAFARTNTPIPESAPRAGTALPSPTHAPGEYALPAAQLVQAQLISLQVEPAWMRPLPQPAMQPVQEAHEAPESREAHAAPEREGHGPAEEPTDDADRGEPDADQPEALLDAPDEADCRGLARSLRVAWAARPRALRAAAEQWRRGRCVVLACPRTADPLGPAWAYVLWPRKQASDGTTGPALRGRRVDALLQWREPPPAMHWCHARMVKQHEPRYGRQLVAVEGSSCRVQLGPVRVPRRAACEVCVRIDAVQRLWSALGTQWSVLVLVCSSPLAGGSAEPPMQEPAC